MLFLLPWSVNQLNCCTNLTVVVHLQTNSTLLNAVNVFLTCTQFTRNERSICNIHFLLKTAYKLSDGSWQQPPCHQQKADNVLSGTEYGTGFTHCLTGRKKNKFETAVGVVLKQAHVFNNTHRSITCRRLGATSCPKLELKNHISLLQQYTMRCMAGGTIHCPTDITSITLAMLKRNCLAVTDSVRTCS